MGDEAKLRDRLRDIGQHLIELSESEDAIFEATFKPAIPLATVVHRSNGIDDKMLLCRLAREEYNERQRRKEVLDDAFLGEPAWNMLLDLFVSYCLDRRISVSSACYAADVPHTTALRSIDLMEERGLVVRVPDAADKRRSWIELTRESFNAMAKYLAQRGESRRADGVSFVGVRRDKI